MKGKRQGIKLTGLYFKEQRRLFGMAAVWIGIFLLLFSLMGVSFHYIWYPALICGVIYFCYVVFDFIHFIRRHRTLDRVKNHIDLTLDNLPQPETVMEQDYRELLEEMLYRKNKSISEIKTAQNEVTEYVTVWTHQIKTPLTALQLLMAETEEPVKTEGMTRLFEMEQYIDMMLQYLRLEGLGTDYVLEEYPVKAMVNQAVKYFARIFISKGIAVHIDIPEKMKVVTDEKWMVFVLKQLISNALKYTKQGRIDISMGEDRVLIIEDTGIGIAPEDLPRIFERGYTGYNGRKDKKATGLGLFLVERILKQLQHQIVIESELNVGTRVSIHLGK